MNRVSYKANPDGSGELVVCAWCFPDGDIFRLFPRLKGVLVNHKICNDHKVKMNQIYGRTGAKGILNES